MASTRFKWEPVALMVLVMALGVWLVWNSKNKLVGIEPTPGARTVELRVGNERGVIEYIVDQSVTSPGTQGTLRVHLRNGFTSDWMTHEAFARQFGEESLRGIVQQQDNPVFRLLNITSWASLAWVVVGFAGQGAFFGRMFIQWVQSEKSKASVVPPIFWWFSLIGGVLLFVYFVWRQDFVGVLGQSTGLVIYARNLKLIAKQRKRDAAQA